MGRIECKNWTKGIGLDVDIDIDELVKDQYDKIDGIEITSLKKLMEVYVKAIDEKLTDFIQRHKDDYKKLRKTAADTAKEMLLKGNFSFTRDVSGNPVEFRFDVDPANNRGLWG